LNVADLSRVRDELDTVNRRRVDGQTDVIACRGFTDDLEVVDVEVLDRACLHIASDAVGSDLGTGRQLFSGSWKLRVERQFRVTGRHFGFEDIDDDDDDDEL